MLQQHEITLSKKIGRHALCLSAAFVLGATSAPLSAADFLVTNLRQDLRLYFPSWERVVLSRDGRTMFELSESERKEDLNGDGDSDDRSLMVIEMGSGETTVLQSTETVFASRTHPSGEYVVIQDEERVIHVLDSNSLQSHRVGISAIRGWSASCDTGCRGPTCDLSHSSFFSGDWLYLRDEDAVLHAYHLPTGDLRSTRIAYTDCSLWMWPLYWASEWTLGDLNDDGDTTDRVLHFYDSESNTTRNLQITESGAYLARAHGPWQIFETNEHSQGVDFNDDGDTEDVVSIAYHTESDEWQTLPQGQLIFSSGSWVFVEPATGPSLAYDLRTGATIELAERLVECRPNDADAQVVADRYAFLYRRESCNPRTDLNGDGDWRDNVLHLIDLETGTVTNLQSVGHVVVYGDRVFVVADRMYEVDLTSHLLINVPFLTFPAGSRIDAWNMEYKPALGVGVFPVPEDLHGDLNGDEDTSDEVLHAFDLPNQRVVNLGIVVESPGALNYDSHDGFLFMVNEESQGSDLNGDGDVEDDVVHHVGLVSAFRRGDCNDDGTVNISDASCMLDWLFLGSATPGCAAIANTNGDENADISDASYLLNFLFLGGPPPAPPYPDCGTSDLEADAALGCVETSEHCP